MTKSTTASKVAKWIFFVLTIAIIAGIMLQRDWLYDWYRGITYEPSSEMANIRKSLKLTGRGEFLFNAAQPILNSDDEFNSYCRHTDTEIAILGCYTNDDIHIYNITAAELQGIRELTAAHELLHVVFARMPETQKSEFKPILEQVYYANLDILESDINTYDDSEKFEELYVRAGTEIKNLPAKLESHYAEFFTDQDHIVDFYNSYISVFRQLEAELNALSAEMDVLNNQITAKTAEYESRAAQLNADIISFNSCAEVPGCFASNAAFRTRRNQILAEQSALDALYNEINQLIATYNQKVEIYNEYVIKNEKLNMVINSSIKPDSL